MTENPKIEIHKEEYPDKYTWGSANDRKEFRFNASNEKESQDRIKAYAKIVKEANEQVISRE